MSEPRIHPDVYVAESVLKRASRDWKENSIEGSTDLRVRLQAWEEEFGVRLVYLGTRNEIISYYLYCGKIQSLSIPIQSSTLITCVPWLMPLPEKERLCLKGACLVAEDYTSAAGVRVIFSLMLCEVSRVYVFDYVDYEARRLRYEWVSTRVCYLD